MDTPNRQTSRRTALQQLAGGVTAAAGVFPMLGQNPPPKNHHTTHPVTKGAASYTYRFFSPRQLETLDALGETIIPTDDHSPGAKAAHVSEYIDAIVSDAANTTKELWIHGLEEVERTAHEKVQLAYAQCSFHQQTEILAALEGSEEPPVSPPSEFFKALKRATVDGYYTSAIGIFQELRYQGNQALFEFPGCEHSEREPITHE
jgi:hypothetical protein